MKKIMKTSTAEMFSIFKLMCHWYKHWERKHLHVDMTHLKYG